MALQVRLLHGLVVLLLKVTIEGNVLVDSQGLTASVAGDELQLGIGQAGMPRQPGDRTASLLSKRLRAWLLSL